MAEDNPLSRIASNEGEGGDSRARITNDRSGGGGGGRRRSRSRSPVRRGGGGGGGGGRGFVRTGRDVENLVSISNIPFEVRWMELKDLLRQKAGDTAFVEILEHRDGRSKGSAIVQFKNKADVEACCAAQMSMKDRSIKCNAIRDPHAFFRRIKEETGKDFMDGGSGGSRGGGGGGLGGGGRMGGRPGGNRRDGGRQLATGTYETYGLSPNFLNQLGIDGPLCSRVFVANLAYECQSGKIMDIFSMAGRVTWIDLQVDNDGKNKGLCVIEYSHPLEAVQAISMFDKQNLYDRRLGVKMDRFEAEHERRRPGQLPEGMRCVGTGLGANGAPLENIGSMITQCGLGTTQMQQPAVIVQQPMIVPQQQAIVQQQQPLLNSGSFAQSGAMYTSSMAAPQQQLQQQTQPNFQQQVQQQTQMSNNAMVDNSRGFGQVQQNQQSNQQFAGGQQQQLFNQQQQQPILTNTSNASGGTLGGGGQGTNQSFGQGGQQLKFESTQDQGGYHASQFDQGGNQGGGGAVFGRDSAVFPSGGADRSSNGNEQSNRTLIIRNLPQDYTWQMVKERLQRMGDVEYCNIREPGVARVTFRNVEAAEKVYAALQGSVVESRTINVNYG